MNTHAGWVLAFRFFWPALCKSCLQETYVHRSSYHAYPVDTQTKTDTK